MRLALVAVLVAFLVVTPVGLLSPSPADAAPVPFPPPDRERGLVGALVHSRWIDRASPWPPDEVAGLLRRVGPEVVPFGIPVNSAAARAAAPEVTEAWLERTAALGLAVVPSVNTFALPKDQQTAEGLRGFFATLAPVLEGQPHVLAVAGANEPLTRGKAWSSPAEAAARVRLEYEAWHAVTDLPLCHKFTNPAIDTPGTEWALLEALWATHQDAICYDWYASNRDTLGTLDRLQELGRRLGKPVHVLEMAVPGNDPSLLDQMARRVDSIAVYQLLAQRGGEDERHGAYVLEADGTLVERPPGAMLRDALPAAAR